MVNLQSSGSSSVLLYFSGCNFHLGNVLPMCTFLKKALGSSRATPAAFVRSIPPSFDGKWRHSFYPTVKLTRSLYRQVASEAFPETIACLLNSLRTFHVPSSPLANVIFGGRRSMVGVLRVFWRLEIPGDGETATKPPLQIVAILFVAHPTFLKRLRRCTHFFLLLSFLLLSLLKKKCKF